MREQRTAARSSIRARCPTRFTRLKALASRRAHYLDACQDEDDLDSVAIRMGAAFHASLFENRRSCATSAVAPARIWERFEKTWKEIDAVILNGPEYEVAMGMIDALRRHKRAMELLFDGTTREHTILWTRPIASTAVPRDARRVHEDRSVELKSARCTEPKWFMREALKRFYHAQLGWYDDAIEHELGTRPAESYIVACENAKPFNVTVFRLPAETREARSSCAASGGSAARRRDQQLLRRIRRGRCRPRAAATPSSPSRSRGRRRALHAA
jgi:hypothetical protein